MKNITHTSKTIIKVLFGVIILFFISYCDKKTPEPTLENSAYTGEPRIVILSNTLSTSSVAGFGLAGNTYSFTVRAQSKEGLLLVRMDVLDNKNNIVTNFSGSSSSSNSNNYNPQQNFSNINITDFTGTFNLKMPSDAKDSVKIRATLVDKMEHSEYAYFTVYLKRIPFKIYFNNNKYFGDSVVSKAVNANSDFGVYLLTEASILPKTITYECYKKATKKSLLGFPQKDYFSKSNNDGYYAELTFKTNDTGIYVLKAYAKDYYGTADTTEMTLYSRPPFATSRTSISIGAQNNTALGISFSVIYGYYTDTYKYLRGYPTTKSTLSYVYDNTTPYLASIYERKTNNFYGDSLPANTQDTRFIELNLPVSSYDTISGNYIFSMDIPTTSLGRIPISTSKLIGFQDVDKNKGVLKINSIITGSTGSINFSTKYQYKLGSE